MTRSVFQTARGWSFCGSLLLGSFLHSPAASAGQAKAAKPSRSLPSAARPAAKKSRTRSPRARRPPPPSAQQAFENPHGTSSARPRAVSAMDLEPGEIEIQLLSKELDELGGRKVVLHIKKVSIADGDNETQLEALTNPNGVARFKDLQVTTDYLYRIESTEGPATYNVPEFQFRAGRGGTRVTLPIAPATTDLGSLVLMSRGLMAVIPSENKFVVDVMWRIENYSKSSWVPKDVVFALPEGFSALTFKEKGNVPRFDRSGDDAVQLMGTFGPGRHDLMFRFYLSTDQEASKTFSFPAKINLGSFRVLLESGPNMDLTVDGFPKPEESRNRKGQRRLVASRDFMEEKSAAPATIDVTISGIPTPPPGRGFAVGLAGALALLGLGQTLQRRRRRASAASQLTHEDVEKASELILSELVELEQAFEKKEIGRKLHDGTRRQLIEAYARLHSEDEPSLG